MLSVLSFSVLSVPLQAGSDRRKSRSAAVGIIHVRELNPIYCIWHTASVDLMVTALSYGVRDHLAVNAEFCTPVNSA